MDTRPSSPAGEQQAAMCIMPGVVWHSHWQPPVGGIAAKRNAVQHSSPKGELADFILRASGRHSWAVDTAYKARLFTVWHHTTKSGPPKP